jgi:hypothetical protein
MGVSWMPREGEFFNYGFDNCVVTQEPTPANNYSLVAKVVDIEGFRSINFRVTPGWNPETAFKLVRVTVVDYPKDFNLWRLLLDHIFYSTSKIRICESLSGRKESFFISNRVLAHFDRTKTIQFFILLSQIRYTRDALTALEVTAVFEEREPQNGLQAFLTGAEST